MDTRRGFLATLLSLFAGAAVVKVATPIEKIEQASLPDGVGETIQGPVICREQLQFQHNAEKFVEEYSKQLQLKTKRLWEFQFRKDALAINLRTHSTP